ncbi:uncharacterized protein LOC113856500 [Abrus precatorius]|uniref:Uncharacterized protein LOC113856500 n=1 Tax=Abrus precatorius TaxID=3816 RepID=A0A8B8KK23_ABRPR|nr:uncharacterized protein LOC113856500 [Abrus precatorius]
MEKNPTAISITSTFNCDNEKQTSIRGGEGLMGLAVHSQVIKIKQEIERIKHPSLQLHMRRVFLRDVTRLRSRSPLGLAERAILVGNSRC